MRQRIDTSAPALPSLWRSDETVSQVSGALRDLATHLPAHELACNFWSHVTLKEVCNLPLPTLDAGTVRQLKQELADQLTAPPICAIPAVFVLSLAYNNCAPDSRRSAPWTYAWHGLARIRDDDRATRRTFSCFLNRGRPRLFRYSPIRGSGTGPRPIVAVPLFRPSLSRLVRPQGGTSHPAWSSLRPVLEALGPSDFLVTHGLRWFADVLGQQPQEAGTLPKFQEALGTMRVAPALAPMHRMFETYAASHAQLVLPSGQPLTLGGARLLPH